MTRPAGSGCARRQDRRHSPAQGAGISQPSIPTHWGLVKGQSALCMCPGDAPPSCSVVGVQLLPSRSGGMVNNLWWLHESAPQPMHVKLTARIAHPYREPSPIHHLDTHQESPISNMRFIVSAIALVAALALPAAGATTVAPFSKTTSTKTVYVPKQAQFCDQAVTTTKNGGPRKYCARCNTQTTVGASGSVTLQVGGCNGQPLTRVATFNATSAQFLVPVQAAGFEVASINAASISSNSVQPMSGTTLTLGETGTTVNVAGDLTVQGISTHYSLETFSGDIATDTIYSASDGVSVTTPGSGDESTQIGAGGKPWSEVRV